MTVYADRKKTDNANEIRYNNTNVEAELNKLNRNLENNRIKSVSYTGTTDSNGWLIINISDLGIDTRVHQIQNIKSTTGFIAWNEVSTSLYVLSMNSANGSVITNANKSMNLVIYYI